MEHQQQVLFNNQDQTRSKMAAFLEAAASGKLWTNRGEDGSAETVENEGKKEKSSRKTKGKEDEIVSGSGLNTFLNLKVLKEFLF